MLANLGPDKQWTTPLLELFTLVGMKWAEYRGKPRVRPISKWSAFEEPMILSHDIAPAMDPDSDIEIVNQCPRNRRFENRAFDLVEANEDSVRLKMSPRHSQQRPYLSDVAALDNGMPVPIPRASHEANGDQSVQRGDTLVIRNTNSMDSSSTSTASLFQQISYGQLMLLFDNMLHSVDGLIDGDNRHRAASQHSPHYTPISRDSAADFVHRVTCIMIRTYCLSNDSENIYPEEILHDMLVSSGQLVCTLCGIIHHRDDSNAVISLLLRRFLSLHTHPAHQSPSPSFTKGSRVNDENQTPRRSPLKSTKNQKKSRKRTRCEMSGDDEADGSPEKKRMKAKDGSPVKKTKAMGTTSEFWCKSLPLPICKWIVQLMLDSPKISSDAISKYGKSLFNGFWNLVRDTMSQQIKEQTEHKQGDEVTTSTSRESTLAMQHIGMFLNLALKCSDELRSEFIHQSMANFHQIATLIHQSRLPASSNGPGLFQNESLSLLLRCTALMNQAVLSLDHQSSKNQMEGNVSCIEQQEDKECRAPAGNTTMESKYGGSTFPAHYKMTFNRSPYPQTWQEGRSFYRTHCADIVYSAAQVKDGLFLTPLTRKGVSKLLDSVHAAFKERGYQFEDQWCQEPLSPDTMSSLVGCTNVSLQRYVDSILYITWILADELKSSFTYTAPSPDGDSHHPSKSLFVDMLRLLVILPFSRCNGNVNPLSPRCTALPLEQIRNALNWKSPVNPSSPMCLILVSRILSLAFHYSPKKVPLQKDKYQAAQWKQEIPPDLLIWMLETMQTICNFIKKQQATDSTNRRDHWWLHLIINLFLSTISHQLIRDGSAVAQLATLCPKNEQSRCTMTTTAPFEHLFHLSVSCINDIVYPQLLALCDLNITLYRQFMEEFCVKYQEEEDKRQRINDDSNPDERDCLGKTARIRLLNYEYIRDANRRGPDFPADCFDEVELSMQPLTPFPVLLDTIWRLHLLSTLKLPARGGMSHPIRRRSSIVLNDQRRNLSEPKKRRLAMSRDHGITLQVSQPPHDEESSDVKSCSSHDHTGNAVRGSTDNMDEDDEEALTQSTKDSDVNIADVGIPMTAVKRERWTGQLSDVALYHQQWDGSSVHHVDGYLQFASSHSILGIKANLQALSTLLYQFAHRFPELLVADRAEADGEEEEEKRDKATNAEKRCNAQVVGIFMPALFNKTFAFIQPSFDRTFDTLQSAMQIEDVRTTVHHVRIHRVLKCMLSAKEAMKEPQRLLLKELMPCLSFLESIPGKAFLEYFGSDHGHLESGTSVTSIETVGLKETMQILFQSLCGCLLLPPPAAGAVDFKRAVVSLINYLFEEFTTFGRPKHVEILHCCLMELTKDEVRRCCKQLMSPMMTDLLTFDYFANIIKYHIQFVRSRNGKERSSPFIASVLDFYQSFDWRHHFINVHLHIGSVSKSLDDNMELFLSLSLLTHSPHLWITCFNRAFGGDLTKIPSSRIAQFVRLDFVPLLHFNQRSSAAPHLPKTDKVPISHRHKWFNNSPLDILANVAAVESASSMIVQSPQSISPSPPQRLALRGINAPKEHPLSRPSMRGEVHQNLNTECTNLRSDRGVRKQPLYRCSSCNVQCCSSCIQLCHYRHTVEFVGDILGSCSCGKRDNQHITVQRDSQQPTSSLCKLSQSVPLDRMPRDIRLDTELLCRNDWNEDRIQELVKSLYSVFESFTRSLCFQRTKWLQSVLTSYESYHSKPFEMVSLSSFKRSAFSVKAELRSSIHWLQCVPMSILCAFQRPIFAVAEKKVFKVYSAKGLRRASGSQSVGLDKATDLGKPYLKEDFSFNIRGIVRNEWNENFVVVYGEKECRILELKLPQTQVHRNQFATNTADSILHDRLRLSLNSFRKRRKLELGLEYMVQQHRTKIMILKVLWVPDRNKTKLMVITNLFIRLYDVASVGGLYSPSLTLNVPPAAFASPKMNLQRPEIADATFYYSPTYNQLIIFALLNTTDIYYQADCNDLCESVDLQCKLDLNAHHPDLQEMDRFMNALGSESELNHFINSTKQEAVNKSTSRKDCYERYIRALSQKAEVGSIYYSAAVSALFVSLPCISTTIHRSGHRWSRKTFAFEFEDVLSLRIGKCQLLRLSRRNRKAKEVSISWKYATEHVDSSSEESPVEDDDEDDEDDHDEEEEDEDDEQEDDEQEQEEDEDNEDVDMDNANEAQEERISMEDDTKRTEAEQNQENEANPMDQTLPKEVMTENKERGGGSGAAEQESTVKSSTESPCFASWMDLPAEQSCWPTVVVSAIMDIKEGTSANPTGCFIIQRVNGQFMVSDAQSCLDSKYKKCRPLGLSKLHLDGFNARTTLNRVNSNMGFMCLFEDGSLHHIGFKSPVNDSRLKEYEWNDNTTGFLSDWLRSQQPWPRLVPQSRLGGGRDTELDVTIFEQYTRVREDSFEIRGSIPMSKLTESGSSLNRKVSYVAVAQEMEYKHHLTFILNANCIRDVNIIALRLQFVDSQHTPSRITVGDCSTPLTTNYPNKWHEVRVPQRFQNRTLKVDIPLVDCREVPIPTNIEVYCSQKKIGFNRSMMKLRNLPVLKRQTIFKYLNTLWKELSVCSPKKLEMPPFEEFNGVELKNAKYPSEVMLDRLMMKSRSQISALRRQQSARERAFILSKLSGLSTADSKTLDQMTANLLFRSLTKLIENVNCSFESGMDTQSDAAKRMVSEMIQSLIALCRGVLVERNDAIRLQCSAFNLTAASDTGSTYTGEAVFSLLLYFAAVDPQSLMTEVMSLMTRCLLSENHFVRMSFSNHILRSLHLDSISPSNVSKWVATKLSAASSSSDNRSNSSGIGHRSTAMAPLLEPLHQSSTDHLERATRSKETKAVKQTARRAKERKPLPRSVTSRSSGNGLLPSRIHALPTKPVSGGSRSSSSAAENDFFQSMFSHRFRASKNQSTHTEIGDAQGSPSPPHPTLQLEPQTRRRKPIPQQQARATEMTSSIGWNTMYSFDNGAGNGTGMGPSPPPVPMTGNPGMYKQPVLDEIYNTTSSSHKSRLRSTTSSSLDASCSKGMNVTGLKQWGIASRKRVSDIPCSRCNITVRTGQRTICKHPACDDFVLCTECVSDTTEVERQQIHGLHLHSFLLFEGAFCSLSTFCNRRTMASSASSRFFGGPETVEADQNECEWQLGFFRSLAAVVCAEWIYSENGDQDV